MRLLLDTNAYAALLRGHREVSSLVRQASEVLLSAIVVGELLYGFRHGSRYGENAARLEAFLAADAVGLVPVTRTTAHRFGLLAASLRAKGRPIPTNDIWIAAHALETGADLLSADTHFGEVESLPWIGFAPGDDEPSVRERVLRYYADESP